MASLPALHWNGVTPHSTCSLSPVAAKLQRQSQLSDVERDEILALPNRKVLIERGGYLIREDDDAPFCCALLSGFANRQKTTGSGARQILAIHMPGDIVDLQNASLGVSDYSVRALTAVTVAYIPKSALLRLAAEHAGISRALWTDTLIEASIAREWLLNIGQRDARQRISHLFCELAVREHGTGLRESDCCVVPLTQEQIGDATGLTAVHVNRTIQRMRAEGFIRVDSQRMSIIDWPALKAAGDFNRAYLHQPAIENRSLS
jgi:CRP-like cAMP-binding protein